MKQINENRIQCRVVIEGEFNGEKFTYTDPANSDGSQFIWLDDKENPLSQYWWMEGNMSCDCNRWGFLPKHLKDIHNGQCGDKIKLFSITPIEKELPALILEE